MLPLALKAHISVLLKEGKDPSLFSRFRPISLLNIGVKLFAKILTTHLVPYLHDIIHIDKEGFMPTREVTDGCMRAIDVIHMARSRAILSCLLSTDAEKAFDRVDWTFIQQNLKAIGLGPMICSWVGGLYYLPSTRVLVKGVMSSSFTM